MRALNSETLDLLATYGKYASADQRTERADAYEEAGQDCTESGQELRLALSELRALWSDFRSNRPPRP